MVKYRGTQTTYHRWRLYAGKTWQKLAVNFVGLLPEVAGGNRWIPILTDHFIRWQDAVTIPDATVPLVANTLDESVFCHLYR